MRDVRSMFAAAVLTLAATVPAQAGEASAPRECANFARTVLTGAGADALTRACYGEDDAGIMGFIDALVCPILMGHRGDHGPIAIGWDGDVWFARGLFAFKIWDCPPYAN